MSKQCVEALLEELDLVREQKNKIFNLLEVCSATGVKLVRQRDETKMQRDKAEQQRDKALEFLKKALDAMSTNDDEGLFEHVQPVMDMRAFIAEVEADK